MKDKDLEYNEAIEYIKSLAPMYILHERNSPKSSLIFEEAFNSLKDPKNFNWGNKLKIDHVELASLNRQYPDITIMEMLIYPFSQLKKNVKYQKALNIIFQKAFGCGFDKEINIPNAMDCRTFNKAIHELSTKNLKLFLNAGLDVLNPIGENALSYLDRTYSDTNKATYSYASELKSDFIEKTILLLEVIKPNIHENAFTHYKTKILKMAFHAQEYETINIIDEKFGIDFDLKNIVEHDKIFSLKDKIAYCTPASLEPALDFLNKKGIKMSEDNIKIILENAKYAFGDGRDYEQYYLSIKQKLEGKEYKKSIIFKL